MSNLVKFDLKDEAKFATSGGGNLAADFWKNASVQVTISTWTKTLDDKSTTNRAKGGQGMLGCWLEDDKKNRGWANLSLIGKLMLESFNAKQKQSWFKKKGTEEFIELDTPKKILITMDDKDRPAIIKVSFVEATGS
jgi:hypothetical protein